MESVFYPFVSDPRASAYPCPQQDLHPYQFGAKFITPTSNMPMPAMTVPDTQMQVTKSGSAQKTKYYPRLRPKCSVFSAGANPDDDWTKVPELKDRRRMQNRIAQRNHRTRRRKAEAGQTPEDTNGTPVKASGKPHSRQPTVPVSPQPAIVQTEMYGFMDHMFQTLGTNSFFLWDGSSNDLPWYSNAPPSMSPAGTSDSSSYPPLSLDSDNCDEPSTNTNSGTNFEEACLLDDQPHTLPETHWHQNTYPEILESTESESRWWFAHQPSFGGYLYSRELERNKEVWR